MSRNLPEFPDLQHLKKQAKVLLRELQQHDPGTTLTQAQHALARQYGFASWPKLKAHVESLPGRPNTSPEAPGPGPDSGGGYGAGRSLFPRFTERARRTIFLSRYFAERGTRRIEAADLLLGIIQADLDLINRLLPRESPGEDISKAVERRRTTQRGSQRALTLCRASAGESWNEQPVKRIVCIIRRSVPDIFYSAFWTMRFR